MAHWVTLETFASAAEARILRSHLLARGIDCELAEGPEPAPDSRPSSPLRGGVPRPQTGTRVTVPEDKVEDAARLVTVYRETRELGAGTSQIDLGAYSKLSWTTVGVIAFLAWFLYIALVFGFDLLGYPLTDYPLVYRIGMVAVLMGIALFFWAKFIAGRGEPADDDT